MGKKISGYAKVKSLAKVSGKSPDLEKEDVMMLLGKQNNN